MNRFLRVFGVVAFCLALLVAGGIFGADRYYTSQNGQGCASCHEMAVNVSAMHGSAHRNVGCMDCHEASLATKLRHIRVHLFGTPPEAIRLRDVDVVEMVPNCQKCHQHEFASWHAGPHSATYKMIFTNPKQNSHQHLMEDCLRCHGMQLNGSVRELVQPQNTSGPWRLVRKDLADMPAIPCQACHSVHSEGAPQQRPSTRFSISDDPIHHSLAYFDRREQVHFAASALIIPVVYDGRRRVTMSPDPRAAICYQCHAPRFPEGGSAALVHGWEMQVGSGDDRTPMGVHEGLSCIACHAGHGENARASCKTCHPQMSNCGLDVEKMDTTYANPSSLHNIHWVRCSDCHQRGIPKVNVAKN